MYIGENGTKILFNIFIKSLKFSYILFLSSKKCKIPKRERIGDYGYDSENNGALQEI